MKKHTKTYLKHFEYGLNDFIPCEISGDRAVDIHHIEARGMGGSAKSDKIENLMAMTRELHSEYGDKKEYVQGLKDIHASFLATQTPWLKLYEKLPWA